MKSILIAEDEINLREILEELLQIAGFSVAVASNGKWAIEFLKIKEFNILLTDRDMPLVNGGDVIAFAKKIAPNTKIILMTGSKEEGVKKRAMEVGADRVIFKPFDIEELEKTIGELL